MKDRLILAIILFHSRRFYTTTKHLVFHQNRGYTRWSYVLFTSETGVGDSMEALLLQILGPRRGVSWDVFEQAISSARRLTYQLKSK